MKEQSERASSTTHFDRRGATYDEVGDVHQRVASVLLAGMEIRPGFRVLDIATGTGLVAMEAAQRVGRSGRVTGIDVSKGMLAEARKKAAAAGLQNVDFELADAERLALPRASFDCVFCSSALVLMSDIPRALEHWLEFLKPGGGIAFDTPSKPFGLSQMIAEVAARHGIPLAYADIADTPGKCSLLLEGAGFDVVSIKTELVSSDRVEISKAIAFWDSHLDHPAWRAMQQAPAAAREAVRAEYVDRVTAAAVAELVPNDTALNFSFGRKADGNCAFHHSSFWNRRSTANRRGILGDHM